ncbi:hypothetical protein CsSME_00032581 [Camellia sinensis var. sinensis]
MKPVITAPLGISWALIWTPWCQLKKKKSALDWNGNGVGIHGRIALPILLFFNIVFLQTLRVPNPKSNDKHSFASSPCPFLLVHILLYHLSKPYELHIFHLYHWCP